MATEMVKKGDISGSNTTGASNTQVVLQRRRYYAKDGKNTPPSDYAIKPLTSLFTYVVADGIDDVAYPQKGYIYPGDSKYTVKTGLFKKRYKDVFAVSYLPYPASVAVPVTITTEVKNGGSVSVEGTVRLDFKLAPTKGDDLAYFLDDVSNRETIRKDDEIIETMYATQFQEIVERAVQDDMREVFATHPVKLEDIDDLQAQVMEKYNSSAWFTDRHIMITNVAVRADRNALDKLHDKQLAGEIELLNKKVEMQILEAEAKAAAERKRIMKEL